MPFWLMKSEPDEMSIDDLAKLPRRTAPWTGVRNYTARNFMRDAMQVGDLAFFYHSSCPEPGVAGIVRISSPAHPDETQFDPGSDYHDPKATREAPRWMCVDVTLVEKTRLVPLAEMRAAKALAGMATLQRGNRLSITPVTEAEWKAVLKLAAKKPKGA
ncbi:MAG TPA: EVE domain-containing protein [Casimicrobiaceae bacterium]|nr:EVE domain-containing protein [Casimicrobiaceae bacterium]